MPKTERCIAEEKAANIVDKLSDYIHHNRMTDTEIISSCQSILLGNDPTQALLALPQVQREAQRLRVSAHAVLELALDHYFEERSF